LVFGSVVGIFGHIFICLGIIFVAGIFCLCFLPFAIEHDRAKIVEEVKKVDASEPIRFKDFFSWNFVPKLERKYGTHKAPLIFMATFTGITAVCLYLTAFLIENLVLINNPWHRGINGYVMICPIIGSTIISLIGYLTARNTLKNSKNHLTHNYAPFPKDANIFCTNCGSPAPPDAKFCGHCGKQLLK
jgi:ABC-type antimicrobial peptide transport system permease subunit